VLQIFVRKDFDPTGIVLLDPASVRVVTLGSEEFLQLEAARRGKKRLIIEAKAGDTLARLGRRYGLTVGDLARINRFSHNTELQSGQKVVVYSPVGESQRELARGLTPDPRRDRSGVTATRDKAVERGGEKGGSGSARKGESRSTKLAEATLPRERAVAGAPGKAPAGGKASSSRQVASARGDRTRGEQEKSDDKARAKAAPSKTADAVASKTKKK
jgi:hypothetical protein